MVLINGEYSSTCVRYLNLEPDSCYSRANNSILNEDDSIALMMQDNFDEG